MNFLETIVAFLVALTLLIFVHEFGHYLVARACGVRVLRFSIGFGRPLLRWHVGRDRTEWTIASIPLGGYVRMLDEREPESGRIAAEDLPHAFNRKPLLQRSAIVLAGPLANFLLAIVLYTVMGWVGVNEPAPILDAPAAGTPAAEAQLQRGDRVVAVDGDHIRSWNDLRLALLDPLIDGRSASIEVLRNGEPLNLQLDASGLPQDEAERDFLQTLGVRVAPGGVFVAGVLPGGAAASDGLATGDRIVAIDGTRVERAADVIERVQASPGKSLEFRLMRGSDELTLRITPEREGTVGRIGAGLRDQVLMENVRYGPFESVGQGVRQTWDMSVFSLRMLGKMVIGELSLRNLSGPVTIADMAGQTARVGWIAYTTFLALVSISLGVLNLLPIPVLDGGHLVYYVLEALRGRPLSERFMVLTQKAGLAIIMMMMMVALFNDITRLIGS